MTSTEPSVASLSWYADWQSAEHARQFDARSRLSDRQLVENFEAFNDVRLLRGALGRRKFALLEVGCATGEFYRYLRIRCPEVEYFGIDISETAIARAREKYPRGRFFLGRPGVPLRQVLSRMGLADPMEAVYSKDVVHHQTDPLGFVAELLECASEMLVFRTRTRDVGPTVRDPALSCQYHYGGWMPYIVTNLEELIQEIQRLAPEAELSVRRSHTILGGKQNRFLPKDCFLPETGTAETAVGVFLKTDHPGLVRVEDRKDLDRVVPLAFRLTNAFQRLLF